MSEKQKPLTGGPEEQKPQGPDTSVQPAEQKEDQPKEGQPVERSEDDVQALPDYDDDALMVHWTSKS